MTKKEEKGSGKRIFLRILCVILVLVLAAVAAGVIWVNSILNRINRVDGSEPTLSDEEIESILQETDESAETDSDETIEVIEPEEVPKPSQAEILEKPDNTYNILLIGQDRREGQGRQRSDSMILCTINTEKKTLVMTSFLRDLYVDTPDWNGKTYAANRLNVNYAFGGMGMLDAALELNFGIQVDHNIEVDFFGFQDIIDMMGGVDIELTRAEANWMRRGLKEGVNHLNGENALAYARIRKLDSDFARTNRQRTVILALLEKAKGMSISELTALAESFLPLITTDMSNADIVSYIARIFPILPDLQVTTQHIPAVGTYKSASIRGMSVIVPDMEANRKILKETLGS